MYLGLAVAPATWYNEIDGGSQPQEGAMYL